VIQQFFHLAPFRRVQAGSASGRTLDIAVRGRLDLRQALFVAFRRKQMRKLLHKVSSTGILRRISVRA
jgi:hypothetical protein